MGQKPGQKKNRIAKFKPGNEIFESNYKVNKEEQDKKYSHKIGTRGR